MSKITLRDIYLSHGTWALKCMKLGDFLLGGLVSFLLPSQKIPAVSNKAVHRILVIRPGGIGDAVFLLPILKALKSEGISIDVVCEVRNAEIFTSQGYTVFLYTRWRDIWQASQNVYDAVIDTEQWHYISAIISYCMRAEYRIGFATRPLRAKLFNRPVEYGMQEYELYNFVRLFTAGMSTQAIIKDINNSLEIPPSLHLWASEQIPENSATIFIGASIALRRLSGEQLVAIIARLLSQGVDPVLIGGSDVIHMADWIVKNTKDPRVHNFVGTISLIQSAALIQRSRRFIGPDSGMMHVACAVGTPVTATFGPGNLKKWSPQGTRHYVATNNVSCSPCTQFGYTVPTCRKRYHCVQNLGITAYLGAEYGT